jgi:UDP-N-acetylmuramyl pentapeptide phosphotransferase/UDP-N-acetylglucosamine-1-phosphate transferase
LLGFKLDSAFGLFGVSELPQIISFILTMGIYILLINAYNLIDGIDELAGGIIAINLGVFIVLFFILNQFGYLMISVLGLGATLAFLKYNAHPAKIFMGDSGSLPFGMIMSIFTFKIISLLHVLPASLDYSQWMLPVLVAINFIPFFDTLRVFTIRILKGQSPFIGDRNHLHHLLLKNNLGHVKGAFFIHSSHMFIVISVLIIAPYFSLLINLVVVTFLVLTTFEYNTIMRMKIKNRLKSTLNEEESTYLKSNKLLNTLKNMP